MKMILSLMLMVGLACGADPLDIAFKSSLDGSEEAYVELMPPGFDSTKEHDVVFAFHGHGSDRWQFIRDARDECCGVRELAARFGLIVVAPDYRAKTSWMGPKAEADVLQIITELKLRHKVGRVFLAGGSMGGTAVLTFTALHPELIAGVCSLNGMANLVEYDQFQEAIRESFGGGKSEVPEEYKRRSAELWPSRFTMPVAFTTGGQDTVVPPQSVLRLAAQLKADGRKVLSIHRESAGHATNHEDTCAAMEFMLTAAGLKTDDANALQAASQPIVEMLASLKSSTPDLRADAEIFLKGVAWALRYDTPLAPDDLSLVKKALARGSERADLLAANQLPWASKKGRVLRGFHSAVDDSTQPYGVIVPQNYDGTKPLRLDVVLHGSSKPVGMSELRFIQQFDEGDDAKSGPEADFIELHPLGRVENCYRWAGETDVFEAIETVCRNYKIDRDRIVLRGMSMGASGTWHLGLKHPDQFVAIGPYCGYVDTHRFSETPIPNFLKVGPLPPHQEIGLHMLDSVDYAANAGMVPAIAAIGDKDIFFQAHVIMGAAFAKEGLEMVNLISPGTGHVIDPVTHAEQLRRIGEYVSKGLDHDPRQLRFVTWTLKYNRCHWLALLGLGRHYERAEFRASVSDGDEMEITEVMNITRFAIHRPVLRMRISGAEISLPNHRAEEVLVFTKTNDGWKCDGPMGTIPLTGKRPGLQGPIDDAFATSFLCVRGTGQPWNAEADAWAMANLRRFEYEWHHYMRGILPVKNDTEVTESDGRNKHLILFGDPGSNAWIAKMLPKLPVTWTHEEIAIGEQKQPANHHAPVFIFPNPLSADRYVVLNCGHTFHEQEFAAFNYLLFPRLGDWAIMKISPGGAQWQPASPAFPEEVVCAGYFDEAWQNPHIIAP